ncbi:MAG: hypothetical protein ACLPKB_14040, partial [Xanthobacteraceae bacterium]
PIMDTLPPPPPVEIQRPAPAPGRAAAGEVRFISYTTGYASGDNTPPGSTSVTIGNLSGRAGGKGTYDDPITLAVGHSIIKGADIPDYPAGTKFYIPNLRKYFAALDTCGDGDLPQNGPCHTGYQGRVWLDLYIGNVGGDAATDCENDVTGLHLVIQNPASNYAVVPGPVFGNGCARYGEEVLLGAPAKVTSTR